MIVHVCAQSFGMHNCVDQPTKKFRYPIEVKKRGYYIHSIAVRKKSKINILEWQKCIYNCAL